MLPIFTSSSFLALTIIGSPIPEFVSQRDIQDCHNYSGQWKGECIASTNQTSTRAINIEQSSCNLYKIDGYELFNDGVLSTSSDYGSYTFSQDIQIKVMDDSLHLVVNTSHTRKKLKLENEVEHANEVFSLLGETLVSKGEITNVISSAGSATTKTRKHTCEFTRL